MQESQRTAFLPRKRIPHAPGPEIAFQDTGNIYPVQDS